jgi:hypothetical protein
MAIAHNGSVLSLKGLFVALGWITLLKTVPWTDVIATAPLVADGAKKLWNAVAKKSAPAAVPTEAIVAARSPEAEALMQAHARLAALETTVAELQQQMLASTELIKALADQNTELVKRAEANRIRLLWLSAAVVLAGVLAAVGLALLLAR